jgi:hypothetical protein
MGRPTKAAIEAKEWARHRAAIAQERELTAEKPYGDLERSPSGDDWRASGMKRPGAMPVTGLSVKDRLSGLEDALKVERKMRADYERRIMALEEAVRELRGVLG